MPRIAPTYAACRFKYDTVLIAGVMLVVVDGADDVLLEVGEFEEWDQETS
ncbi:MAG TPA: hypothetical protein VGJ20_30315 [Xanthobacteraceae bacterium]|jgi:hypothetical protein